MNPFELRNLPSETLKALIASTNPFGRYQTEARLAREELARRRAQIGRIEFASAAQRERTNRMAMLLVFIGAAGVLLDASVIEIVAAQSGLVITYLLFVDPRGHFTPPRLPSPAGVIAACAA